MRAGLAEGDSGAIRAFRTHAAAREWDELLAWMAETAIACLDESPGLAVTDGSTRCQPRGEVLENLGQANQSTELAVRAVEAAQLDDHDQVCSAVTSLLDVTDTDSRDQGSV